MNEHINPDTIARTIVLIITLINQTLAIFGKEKLPFAESDVYQIVSFVVTIIVSFMTWWKNNSFTKAAIIADGVKDALKAGKQVEIEVIDGD